MDAPVCKDDARQGPVLLIRDAFRRQPAEEGRVGAERQKQADPEGGVGTDMVENADKDGISLPVYFLEFDGYQIDLAEYSC